MKAYNSGKRKSKLIVRFLKGVGSVSLASPLLDKNGVAKKKGNELSLKRAGFGCRPLVWKVANWLENASIILKTGKKRRTILGISNAQFYLLETTGKTYSRKQVSEWLKSSVNKYKVYSYSTFKGGK